MTFTRPKVISNSPQNTSLHTYNNVISGPFKCYFQAFLDVFQVYLDIFRGDNTIFKWVRFRIQGRIYIV